MILLIAAVVSLVVTGWETTVVIALVVLLNATIGFVQESRAQASLAALKKMLVTTAAVRRDGRMVNLDATELVAGDVVAVQAGDRVPAATVRVNPNEVVDIAGCFEVAWIDG